MIVIIRNRIIAKTIITTFLTEVKEFYCYYWGDSVYVTF